MHLNIAQKRNYIQRHWYYNHKELVYLYDALVNIEGKGKNNITVVDREIATQLVQLLFENFEHPSTRKNRCYGCQKYKINTDILLHDISNGNLIYVDFCCQHWDILTKKVEEINMTHHLANERKGYAPR